MKIRVHTRRRGGFAVVLGAVAALAVVGQPASASPCRGSCGDVGGRGLLAAGSVSAAAVTLVSTMYPSRHGVPGCLRVDDQADGTKDEMVQTIFQHWKPHGFTLDNSEVLPKQGTDDCTDKLTTPGRWRMRV